MSEQQEEYCDYCGRSPEEVGELNLVYVSMEATGTDESIQMLLCADCNEVLNADGN